MLLFEVEDQVDVAYFKQAVTGEVPYDSQHPEIREWEYFLIDWLGGDLNEETMMLMWTACETFREHFSYSGVAWRGMLVDKGDFLYPLDVASFSHKKEVAEHFAGMVSQNSLTDEEMEQKDSILLEVQLENAFALDKLLLHISKLTQNQELFWKIRDNGNEGELIQQLTEEQLQFYNYG